MFEQNAIQSIAILIALIFLGMFLRKWKLLNEEHGGLFARIIVNITIPALIFSSLSLTPFSGEKLLLAVVMIITQIIAAFLALIVGRLLKISSPARGALILASTFSSSAFMGYAVIESIYNSDQDALSDAAVVSEIGVALLLFTVGVMIAIHFGKRNNDNYKPIHTLVSFLYSPVFISLISGIIFSFIKLPQDNIIIGSFYKLLHIISGANTFMVALTIGVMLHFKRFRFVWLVVLIAVVIKLVIQPLLAHFQAVLFDFPPLWHQVIVIEASMPTAVMTAIFAKKYKCDPELISILIFTTFISSCITIFMMLFLLT